MMDINLTELIIHLVLWMLGFLFLFPHFLLRSFKKSRWAKRNCFGHYSCEEQGEDIAISSLASLTETKVLL